jgi:hypothetical protein
MTFRPNLPSVLVVALLVAIGAAAPAAAQPQVFTARISNANSGSGTDPDFLMGTIPALAGQSIRVIRVGLAGDAEIQSGPQAFQLVGGGLDFTWGAGQSNPPQVPLDHVLSPTVAEVGSPVGGRGFTYSADLNLTGISGQSMQVRWRGTSDWDGLFAWGTDSEGTSFDDSAAPSSARAWVLYEYTAAAVPTSSPISTTLLVGLIALAGLLVLGRARL